MSSRKQFIQFFHLKLEVRGEAQPIQFEDGTYKFWEVRTKKGERCLVFREMVGMVSLQERFNDWLRKESSLTPVAGLAMIFADHIVPASVESMKAWASTHPKQMKAFDLHLNDQKRAPS